MEGPQLSVPLADADSVISDAWRESWRMPDPLTPSQCAERYRVLTQEASAEHGPWRNDRVPYLVEIMDRMSIDDPCERVVFRKPTQCGGSEVLINALMYFMVHAPPCPIMLTVPGLDMAKRHVKQRIDPSIEASPVWKSKVAPKRSRDSSNTGTEKEFNGSGILIIVTANSSTGLRAMPIMVTLCDEVSKYKRDLDGEGSALDQIRGRTTTFQGSRKELLISSPTIDGACLISEELELTDWRDYHVPCPHCQALHTLEFDNLSDDRMLCPNCGEWISEEHKTWMLAAENGARWVPKHPDRAGYGHGYDLNALYTPFRLGDSWAELAKQRAKARDNPDKAVAFSQMKMGKPYRGERQRADADVLKDRAELGLMVGLVPRGYFILTAGVDCQADRFAIKIMAWGRNERAVVVSYEEIPGDPSHQSGYEALDAHLQREYRKGGVALVPKCIAIDGGNWTEEVASFVRTRQRRMVACGDGFAEQFMVLVRGRSADSTRVVNRPRKSETNARGKTIARSVGQWGVGTGVAKTILFGRIASDGRVIDGQPVPVERRHIRFPGGRRVTSGGVDEVRGSLPEAYYRGLTAEWFDKKANTWVHDKSIPNEPIDTMVYCYFAALHPHVRLDLIKDHEWDSLAEAQEPSICDLFAVADDPDVAPQPEAPPPRKPVPAVPTFPLPPAANPYASDAWSSRL